MVKFIGRDCATNALGRDILEQLVEDKEVCCVCAACYMAFKTMHNSLVREGCNSRYLKKVRIFLDRYWKIVDSKLKANEWKQVHKKLRDDIKEFQKKVDKRPHLYYEIK